MSAQSCGCDAETGWICDVHRAMPTEDERASWQRVVAVSDEMNRQAVQTKEVVQISESVDASLARIEAIIDAMLAEMAVVKCREQRIALVLKAFYRAPITISALQPILELAVELNPDLKS